MQISRIEKCSICFEDFHVSGNANTRSNSYAESSFNKEGIFCSNCHFTCNDDLRSYCAENVFPKLFSVRENKGKTKCPVLNCGTFYDPVALMHKLEVRERTRYITLILDVVQDEEPKIAKIASVIRDILTLSCPSCGIAVDPTPDACSAIMCLNCSAYYCNYCFQGFNSRDTSKDRADAHTHAAQHNPNPNGDAFLPLSIVISGQHKYQQTRLEKCLRMALASPDYIGSESLYVVGLAYVICFDDINSLDIDHLLIWTEAIQDSSTHIRSFPMMQSHEDINLEFEQEPRIMSGKILANAILSQNHEAIKQVLTAFHDNLDINYFETVAVNDENHPRISYPLITLCVLLGLNSVAIQLIDLGADIFAKDSAHGRCALMVVIEKGCEDILDFVHEKYPELDWNYPLTDEQNQYTAIHVASRFGHGHLVSKLVIYGCDLESKELSYGYTALATAILSERTWVAVNLIRSGAKIFTFSNLGISPIYMAVEKGQLIVLQEMLKRFPDALTKTVKRGEGIKALHVAIQFKSNHIVRYIVEYVLHQHNSHRQRVQSILNCKENVTGQSPFVMSVMYNNSVASLMLLKSRQIDVYHSCFDANRLPMFLIVEKGYLEVLKEIVHYYPDIVNRSCEIDQQTGLRPLYIAIQFNQLPIVQFLCDHGADINHQESTSGFTPIMLTVINHNVTGFQMLLQYSPLVTSKRTYQDRKLMFLIAEHGMVDMLVLLLEYFSANENRVNREVFDINDVVGLEGGYSALHVACIFNKSHMATLLLEHGADPFQRSSYNKTIFDVLQENEVGETENAIYHYLLSNNSDGKYTAVLTRYLTVHK